MRTIRQSCLCVLLLVLGAPSALAEEVETDGFTLRIPPGYRKMLDSEMGGGGFSFPMADAFLDGQPDMKTYLKGTPQEPQAAIVAIYMPMKGDQKTISDGELGVAGDQLGNMLQQGFSMEKKTFQGEYEGIVIRCRLEDVPTAQGVEGDFRIALIACGDYAVFVGLVRFQADVAAESDFEWQTLIGSLNIDPPTNWTMILLLVACLGGVVVFFGRVLLKKPPQIQFTPSSPSDFMRPDARAGSPGQEPPVGDAYTPPSFTPAETRSTPRPPSRPGLELPPVNAPAGSGASPLPGPLEPPADTPPSRPESEPEAPDAPGSGLRSTLPSSGRWSDQFKQDE